MAINCQRWYYLYFWRKFDNCILRLIYAFFLIYNFIQVWVIKSKKVEKMLMNTRRCSLHLYYFSLLCEGNFSTYQFNQRREKNHHSENNFLSLEQYYRVISSPVLTNWLDWTPNINRMAFILVQIMILLTISFLIATD